MPDDPPRPASGQQPDPRPTAGAPAWWGALGRPDLPLDSETAAAPQRIAPPAHRLEVPPAPSRLSRHWRAWAFNAAVLAVAVLIVCLGVGALSPSAFLTAVLLFGVPLALATATAMLVARRSR